MSKMKRRSTLSAAMLVLSMTLPMAFAETDIPAATVDLGFSIGANTSNDTQFWGFGLDHTRYVATDWSFTLGAAFDQELIKDNGLTEKFHTIGLGASLNYDFSENWAYSVGVSKAIFDDATTDRSYAFNNGDWGIGFSLGYGSLWRAKRGWSLGLSYEYNLDQHEHTVSLDYGLSLDL